MSGNDGTEDQCERTRERNGTVMGDVLLKEYSVKDLSVEGEALLRDQRQEADGAPDADDDASLLTLVTTFAPASAENAVANDNCEGLIMQQEEAVRCNDLSSIRMDTALVTDNSCSSSVIPVNPPRHTKGPCSCDTCKVRREMFMEELEEAMRLQGLWMELRQHIRSVFNVAIETYHTSNSSRLRYDTSRLVDMHDTVVQLCKRDPHQLFMRLVGQAQEFVVEVKVRLLALLHDRSINNLAEIFLTGLLDGYDALISTASQISELVEPLEKEHLCKFNLTWECFNKKLYQNYVYTDPLVQNNLPPFIGQLRKLLPLKGPEYQGLVHRYLTFDDEMTRIGDLWPETERLIDKYNGEQAARMTRLRKFREGWELFTARRKLIQQQMWDRTMEGESELQELDGQLLTLATRGAVGALTPDSRSPSPSSDFGLDSLNVPPNTEIVQSLLDDWNKSPHQRLADIVGALTVTEGQIGPNGRGIGPPISIPVHYNEPEFRFGYECAASLVLTHTAMKSVSPVHGDRGDGEGSEGGGSEGEEQRCECHVCAVPLVSPTRIGKGPPVNFNLQTNQVDSFPLNSNGLTAGGSTNCIAANGTLDMNGVYPHLYNLYTAFRSMPNNKPSADQSGTALVNNIDDKKLCPVGLQVKQKLVDDAEPRRKQPEEIYNNGVSAEDTDLRIMDPQPCPCIYQHAKEIAERKKEVLENPPCPCLLKSKRKWDTCPCLKKTRTETVVANGHLEPQSSTISTAKTNQETKKAGTRTGSMQSIQTQTRHTTTQTPNTTHSHNHAAHQSTCPTHVHPHGSLPDLVKGTGPTHSRGHSRNNHHRTSHACHKQANIEHIKRVSCNDLSVADGDCSDSGSSQEDSCSSSSSTPRDSSRHCDCCYCEVFGHGVPSVAPVSRNYNEMRERLRQLLTKKKAKKCKAACSPPKSPVEALPLNTNSDSKAASSHSAHRSNTPVSIGISTPRQDQRDQRDLEALLEFIEGNQNGKRDNNKKAEKKARQKQRKLEEKLKKDRQEAERQKLIELQKKTPEVTITVVDPQKPVPQRLLPQRTLPEVSILPASAPLLLTALKQSPSNKKRDKQDSINSSTKAKAVIVNSNQKAKGGTVGTIGSSHRTKAETNVDKVDGNKGNKVQASATVTNRKCHGTGDASESNCIDSSVTNNKLSKKERKKLKKETKKREEVKLKESEKPQLPDNQQPQIVTIKRVMESNCAEPTVTITLKGQTPAEDKVLFTLVNGQTKEPTPLKPEQQQNQNTSGKKKKVKGNNNQSQQGNNGGNNSNKSDSSQQQQQLCNLKQQQTNVNDGKSSKRQSSNEKLKNGKQIEERKLQQLQQSTNETKGTKSKKDKKNTENKENVLQQQNVVNRGKNQQQSVGNKKQSKVGTLPQAPVVQKSRQNSSGVSNECGSRKTKVVQQLDKNNRVTGNKSNKTSNNGTGNANKTKCDGQKDQSKTANQNVPKQRPATEIQNTANERLSSPLSSQFKDIGTNSKINIENLKLPPGITITKVDAPAKPLPIRSAPIPKPVNPPKQTTIIAAPMSGVQSSYASSQSGGNVIVVDTGKLKQDLLPKSSDKDLPKDGQQGQSISGKKKKKKGKSSPNVGNMVNVSMMQSTLTSNNCLTTNEHADEPARILHNPGTNMVTIRNPAFGPPKMEPTQQAAIIKVSENGMVTIRSPALQQAINAGLTPPPKPNFIVKGDLSSNSRTTFPQNSRVKQTNSIIPTSLAELRSRLTPDCTGLTGLANIQISKVTNGQPIPENGINLKGTSVTLTKVRSEAVMDDVQQAKTAVREAISATMAASGSGKGKKKKKRGNGTRQSGDDWNLVESVFTPKDIDLEDGEMDDAERELEAFKRFCLQSVPPARKEKVNLNIKDIVLKKKSSGAATAAVIAAI